MTILTILVIVLCVGLIFFVLVQNPKGGGLNAEFGSAVQLGGAKRATDILEKGTWGLAIGVAILCLVMVQSTDNGNTQMEDFETDPTQIEQPIDNSGEGTDNTVMPVSGPNVPG